MRAKRKMVSFIRKAVVGVLGAMLVCLSAGVCTMATEVVTMETCKITKSGRKLPVEVSYGDQGPAVRSVQKALQDLGYIKSDPDGSFGPTTRWAVCRYQEAAGMPITGVITYEEIMENPVEMPEPTYAELMTGPNGFGDSGRFIIPDLGISVALFQYYAGTFESDNYGQWITDTYDAAAWEPVDRFVADHSTQAFATLPQAYAGMPAMIVHADGSVTNLVCIGAGMGSRTEECLFDYAGRSMFECPGLFMTYTCCPDKWHIFTALWDYAD